MPAKSKLPAHMRSTKLKFRHFRKERNFCPTLCSLNLLRLAIQLSLIIVFFFSLKEEFIDNILNSGVPIGLSSVWLGELYRLVTTYNILGKAGYTLDSPDTNRALINTLNDNMLSEDDDSPFLHHKNPSTLPPAKREGMKFARRVLLATWDSVLEILSAPLETSTSG